MPDVWEEVHSPAEHDSVSIEKPLGNDGENIYWLRFNRGRIHLENCFGVLEYPSNRFRTAGSMIIVRVKPAI
jgi:hypothetical protein